MVSTEERRKLVSQMEDEKISPGCAVLKSLAAILLLFVVAAGPWTLLATDELSGATRPPILPVDQGLGESRKVFDERRRDYESAREKTAVGAEIPMANSDYD